MLLGIDIGTTGVRAAVFEANGTLVADASIACIPRRPRPGWAEADADAWWGATCALCAELSSKVALSSILGIAVTGQAPTAVLVDDAGAPLRPALLWLDTRADAEARELGTEAYYLGAKLLWLARHEPHVVARTRHVLQSHAFVAQQLTDVAATDPSTAALCLPLFDLPTRKWVHDPRVGVRLDQLPPIRRASEVIGRVTARAAAATGLPAGVVVAAGGGDFAAATLGAGVVEPGDACLMLGTAGNLLVPRATAGRDRRLIHAHHVGVEAWLSLGGIMSGGAQEWLRQALVRASGEETTQVRSVLPTFDSLDGEAADLPPGSEGLLFLPWLQGERTPFWDVDVRGAYLGLGLHHTRGHLWRAVLEGIALGFVDCAAVLEDEGVVVRRVVAANGGGKSALFRQILCDALGVPLSYAADARGTIAGAAILAGLAAGVLTDARDAAVRFRGRTVQHTPAPGATALYRELLRLRRSAYDGLREVHAGLAVIRSATEKAVDF